MCESKSVTNFDKKKKRLSKKCFNIRPQWSGKNIKCVYVLGGAQLEEAIRMTPATAESCISAS